MAVLQVEFDGNIEDLQDQLDDADLETEATVKAEAEGPVGTGGQEEDQGLIGTAARGAIVGAILTVVGLLTPIKEILEGIRNFFLLTLAPVFSALRPVFDLLRDLLIGLSRFLAGDLTLQDIISGIVDSLKQMANQLVNTLDNAVDFVDLNAPFPESGEGRNRGGGTSTNPDRTRQNQDSAFNPSDPISLIENAANAGTNFGQSFLPDRTDEAQKDMTANEVRNFLTGQYGGDTGNTGGGG